eukprot:8687013-Alexandrium_andersonii.AAC.1
MPRCTANLFGMGTCTPQGQTHPRLDAHGYTRNTAGANMIALATHATPQEQERARPARQGSRPH